MSEACEEVRREERHRAASMADSEGHHWSGAPALAFFALADAIRGQVGDLSRQPHGEFAEGYREGVLSQRHHPVSEAERGDD